MGAMGAYERALVGPGGRVIITKKDHQVDCLQQNKMTLTTDQIEKVLKAKGQPAYGKEITLRQNLKCSKKELWKRFGIVVKGRRDLEYVACFNA